MLFLIVPVSRLTLGFLTNLLKLVIILAHATNFDEEGNFMSSEQPKNMWLILITTSLVTFMSVLDASIVNIAMPAISSDLKIPMNRAEWAVSFYIILICMLITLFGKLGDEIGKIRIFRAGMVIFVLGSLVCGLSHSLTMLLAGRLVQGLGASMTMATNYGIITQIFPRNRRGRALGILNSFVSLGSIAGPGIGGLVLQAWHWQDIFMINVPIGIVTFVLGLFVLPRNAHSWHFNLDGGGFLLWALAILSLFTAIFWGQEIGFTQWRILGLIVLAIILFGLFYHVEQHQDQPMLNFKIFSNHEFTVGLTCALLVFTTTFFANVLMPFYLEKTLALSAFAAGIVLMGIPIMMLITAPISGSLADSHGAQGLTFTGLVILTLAEAYFAIMSPNHPFGLMVVAICLSGIGIGMFQSPNNSIIMSSVSKKYLGIAGSLNGLAREIGMIFGMSLSTSILYLGMSHRAGHHVTTYVTAHPEWFVTGMHLAYAVATLCGIIAMLLTARRLWIEKRGMSHER
jgi:EmrB/QacA subfamily drug resistance transporter